MNRKLALLLVFAMVAVGPAATLRAEPTFEYISQTRTIAATAAISDNASMDSKSASDFGPFDATVSADKSEPLEGSDPPIVLTSSANGSMTSSLLPNELRVSVSGSGSWNDIEPYTHADVHGVFDIRFSVAEPLDYTVESGGSYFSAHLRDGIGNEILDLSDPGGTNQGTLAVGEYQLQADFHPDSSSDIGFGFQNFSYGMIVSLRTAAIEPPPP